MNTPGIIFVAVDARFDARQEVSGFVARVMLAYNRCSCLFVVVVRFDRRFRDFSGNAKLWAGALGPSAAFDSTDSGAIIVCPSSVSPIVSRWH